MACSATFDPLGAAYGLEAAGIERKQAEALARANEAAVTVAVAAIEDDLATKNDIRVAVAELESRISRDITNAVVKVVLAVSLVNTVIGGVIVAVLKLL